MSNENRPIFILAGNGPYENRGCEAIVRGTVKIIREHFDNPVFVSISNFNTAMQYKEQCLKETDKAIIHLATHRLNKKTILHNVWKLKTWRALSRFILTRDNYYLSMYDDILPYMNGAEAVLSVGGDNYSLDYGIPNRYIALDNLVISFHKPIVLWGSSIGPFSAIPSYEIFMSEHLQKVTGIFARESETIGYLVKIGVINNVFPVADPAFLMESTKPLQDVSIEKDTIGINISPLMAKFTTGGDLKKWSILAAGIISGIAERTDMPVLLIPHVTSPHSNDYEFMKSLFTHFSRKDNDITLLTPSYTASEIKWIISQMSIFAGSRTHATIAALSSEIPTLSFGYSIKALGINKDIFGHMNYCLNPLEINVTNVVDRIMTLLNKNTAIKKELAERIPQIQSSASNAGKILRMLIHDDLDVRISVN